MSLDLFILILCSVAISLLGLLVFLRNPKIGTNQRFALLSISMMAWTGFNFLSEIVSSNVLLTTRLTFLSGAITVFTLINFMARFPNEKVMKNSRAWLAQKILTICVVPLTITPYVVSGVDIQGEGQIHTSFAYPLYVAYILFSLVCLILIIRKQLKKADSVVHKQQIRTVSWGVALYSVLAVTTNLILPLLVNNWSSSRFGPASALIFVALVGYTVIKHRLFDIRLVVARSLGYGLSLGLLSAFYALFSYVLSSSITSRSNNSIYGAVFNVLLLLIVAVSFATVKKFFDRLTNKIFYKDAYDPQDLLNDLNKSILKNVNVEQLANEATDIINRHIKTPICSIILNETEYSAERILGTHLRIKKEDLETIRQLALQTDANVCVSDELYTVGSRTQELLHKNEVGSFAKLSSSNSYGAEGVGLLVLGIKSSGSPYSKQDVNILGIIRSELTIAIENALRFEEIEKFSLTLQGKVDDATRKLQRANEKLKALDETKDEFISMASHQLRTPLTSVKGYVSMVLEGDAGELKPMQRKLLEQSFASSQRMVYLIADLLNLSRLRTGKFVIEAKPTNLAEVIESEVEQLKVSAAGRNLTLDYKKPEGFPSLMIDETKIRQVIMNFADNAIYYTTAGGAIEIKLKQTKDSVEFTVNDNGIGIPPAEQHHLFNKFYRAKNAQKARPDGTGLGLFMAKKVIIAQGGAIVFKSVENKGSTFGFTFSKQKLKIPDHLQTQNSPSQ